MPENRPPDVMARVLKMPDESCWRRAGMLLRWKWPNPGHNIWKLSFMGGSTKGPGEGASWFDLVRAYRRKG